MCNSDDIGTRLEDLKEYIYREITQIIKDNKYKDSVGVLKYKPTKHKKSYKLDGNNKKRCYTR